MPTLDAKLTLTDYDRLLSALDAWEHEPSRQGFGLSILEGMMERDDRKRRERMDVERKKTDGEVALRKQQAALLRAKLMMLRAEADQEALAE